MKMIKIALLTFVLALAGFGHADATYTQQAALAVDGVFQGQVMVAMLQTSANVMTEAVTTAGHLQRAAFAVKVIQNPTVWQPILSALLASQGNNPMTPLTVPSTVADTLVQTAMDAQWSNLAGYFKQ